MLAFACALALAATPAAGAAELEASTLHRTVEVQRPMPSPAPLDRQRLPGLAETPYAEPPTAALRTTPALPPVKAGPSFWAWAALAVAVVGGITTATVLALDGSGGPRIEPSTGSVRGTY